MTSADSINFGVYLRAGGKLWLAAPDFVLFYLWASSPQCPSWLHISSYNLSFVNESIPIDSLIGVSSNPIGDGLTINTNPNEHIEGDYTDRLRPANGAVGCLTGPSWDSNWNQIDSIFYCAISFDSAATGQKLFYMSSAFEGIPSSADRDTLMARVLSWFGWSPYNYKDGKLERIQRPGDIVSTGSSVPVIIEVKSNNIAALSSAWVYAVIETLPGFPVYEDSAVVSIPGLTTIAVNLSNWTTNGVDTVQMTAWVSVPGDINTTNDTLQKTVMVLPVIYQTDFESGLGKWRGDWGLTTEYANSGTYSFTDRPYQNYPVNSDLFSMLDSSFNFTGYSSINLVFTHRHWLEQRYDFGIVIVSPDGGVNWDSLGNYTGLDTLWHSANIDLSSYNSSSNFKFGFRLGSDPLLNMKGWFIDDIVLLAYTVTGVEVESGTLISSKDEFSFIAPNPASKQTTISYQVTKDNSSVSLKVYNLAGQLIKILTEGKIGAGTHCALWNGVDSQGRHISSGVYFVRLQINDSVATKRLVWVK